MPLADLPPIVRAAQSPSVLHAAFAYAALGLSVVPLQGKCPTLSWSRFQRRAASSRTILAWHAAGLLHNIGLVCGGVSRNLVVLDLDAPQSYPVLKGLFPALLNTYTVSTGSGKGKHLYWHTLQLPATLRLLKTPLGNLELRAQGCLVVAPPSLHPETHHPYCAECAVPIQTVPDLTELIAWLKTFGPEQAANSARQVKPYPFSKPPDLAHALNPSVLKALVTYFEGKGYKRRAEWLNGSCICPHHHRQGDIHSSFGFNTRTGYGYCFFCGTFLAKDICKIVGIVPNALGGLMLPA